MKGCNKTLSLLLVCLIGSECVCGLSRDIIISMAKLHCPGGETRICPTNSSHASIGHKASNTCCLDCSCDPGCTEYENCCFSNHPDYPKGNRSSNFDNVKIFLDNDTTIVNECLYPLSPQPRHNVVNIQHHSFWMISKVKDHGGLSKTQKCGLINVTPWGSLLPVSSKKTGHIYKNIVCAKENFVNDEDIVNWEAAYVCDVKRGRMFELTEAFVNSCQVQFNAPRGIPVRRSNLCFPNLIDTCPEKDFKIPDDITMNQTEVIDACTSGFLSPYRVVDMYANIFCHICNEYYKAAPYKCRIHSTSFGGRIGRKVSGLIDSNYLKHLARDKDNRIESTKMACLNKDDVPKSAAGTCRPRFCPIGQTRNSKGECFYAISRLTNALFYITIELKSEDPILSIDYFQHLHDQIANLKSPLLNLFKITHIFYKELSFFNVTNTLLIYLSKQSAKASIKRVVNFVRENVKKKWLFIVNNSSLTFSSSLSNSVGPLPYNENVFTEVFREGLSSASDGMILHLTKLYYCENVRLESSEFNVSSQNVVFDKISNRFLHDAEYSLAKPEGQNATCNVCIDGSSFHVLDKNHSAANSNSFGAMYIVICVFVIGLMN